MRWLSGLDGVLGGALGHVASLLANTTKQNEVTSKTPTEEPDKTQEINNKPYEESEDLDEDEGFKLKM